MHVNRNDIRLNESVEMDRQNPSVILTRQQDLVMTNPALTSLILSREYHPNQKHSTNATLNRLGCHVKWEKVSNDSTFHCGVDSIYSIESIENSKNTDVIKRSFDLNLHLPKIILHNSSYDTIFVNEEVVVVVTLDHRNKKCCIVIDTVYGVQKNINLKIEKGNYKQFLRDEKRKSFLNGYYLLFTNKNNQKIIFNRLGSSTIRFLNLLKFIPSYAKKVRIVQIEIFERFLYALYETFTKDDETYLQLLKID